KNEVLYRQGSDEQGFYYLYNGKCSIHVLGIDGHERMIDVIYPGRLLGEQMVNGSSSFTTAKAMENSIVYFFSKENFSKIVQKYPDVADSFSHSLIKKIRFLVRINLLVKAPAEVQLAAFFLNVLEGKQSNTLEFTQKDLANYIGKSRVTVWKLLREFEKQKIIHLSTKQIIIKEVKALYDIVHLNSG